MEGVLWFSCQRSAISYELEARRPFEAEAAASCPVHYLVKMGG